MSSPERKIEVGIFAIFSDLFRLFGLASGYSGNFPLVSSFSPPEKGTNDPPGQACFFIKSILPEKPLSMQVSKWTQITDLRPFYDRLHKGKSKTS